MVVRKRGDSDLHDMKRFDNKLFGNRLRAIRKDRNVTTDILAEKAEVSTVFIRQIESGYKKPSISSFVAICNALRIESDCLLADFLESEGNNRDKEKYELLPSQIEIVDALIRQMSEQNKKDNAANQE